MNKSIGFPWQPLKMAVTFLLLIELMALAGCEPMPTPTPATTAPPPASTPVPLTPRPELPPTGILRFAANVADLGDADPHFAAGGQQRILADMVFNGLLRYKPGEAPELEPDLAEAIPEPQMVDGQQVWTFQLRKGVMCHPGPKTRAYELTADDVVYSLHKSADPKRCSYSNDYRGMTVEKVDDYTVRLIPAQPMSTILFFPKVTNYDGGFIVCQKAVEAMGDAAFNQHPVGTGPFMFESYTPKEQVRLAANPSYFRGRPRLAGVEIVFMPDDDQRVAALIAGRIDVTYPKADSAAIEQLSKEQDIKVDFHGVGETVTLFFNLTVKPLDDVRVRQAIAYALDRDTFQATFGNHLAVQVHSPVPAQFLPGGLTEQEVKALNLDYSHNLAKAKQLLTEAGYPNGFSLEVVSSEMAVYYKAYESLQTQLAAVGIQLKINRAAHADYHAQIRADKNPIVIYIAWLPNADTYLTRFFHSSTVIVTGPKPDINFSHYTQLDQLIEAARLETNPSKQIEIWKQAQIKILSDMVAYPAIYLNMVHARRSYVDYGHKVAVAMPLYPQITEQTQLVK